jgi:hypothetical protein
MISKMHAMLLSVFSLFKFYFDAPLIHSMFLVPTHFDGSNSADLVIMHLYVFFSTIILEQILSLG